jgi:hypothetical protein
MKNQPTFEECAFSVRPAVRISYAVLFGSRQFIHRPSFLYFNAMGVQAPLIVIPLDEFFGAQTHVPGLS